MKKSAVASNSRGRAAKRQANQPDVVVRGRRAAQAQATVSRRGDTVALLSRKPYADGWQAGREHPHETAREELATLCVLLQNLYAPSQLRAYWRGKQKALADRLDTDVKAEAETNKNTNTIRNRMKKHLESATSAFGLLLTALVAIVTDLISTAKEGTAATAEAPAKGGKGGGAKAKEEEPENNDDDLLGGGDEPEPEPEVTIDQLKVAGQAAIKAGKADKMKAVLKKHGAENLGGLSKDDYPAVLTALKKLA